MFSKAQDSRAIGNLFVRKFRDDGKELTILALVKLVYIAHGWALCRTGKPLVNHEVRVWRYGPAIPAVYEAFANQVPGSHEVVREARKYHPGGAVGGFHKTFLLSDEQQEVVDWVYKHYSDKPAWELSDITHSKDSPWYAARKNGLYFTIPNEKIKLHYQKLGEQHD